MNADLLDLRKRQNNSELAESAPLWGCHSKLLGIQLFLDTCSLTRQGTQVVKLGFANIASTLDFNRVDQW
jgi:hypothetical protein